MIRLFVIDDHPVIAAGIHYDVHPSREGIRLVGSAVNVHDAVYLVNPDDLDIFILDLYIHQTIPVDNVRTLKRKFPGKKIVIYSVETSGSWVKLMIKEGVSAYISKEVNSSEFKATIIKVFNGESVFPAFEISQTASDIIGNMTANFSLQPIQKQIIRLLLSGLTIPQIADITGINGYKASNLLRKVRKQFKVKNNIELINRILQEYFGFNAGQTFL